MTRSAFPRSLVAVLAAVFPLALAPWLASAGEGSGPAATPQAAATAAAETWLKLVDAGDYARSWKETSAYFQANVTAAKWEEALTGARKPLGKLVSRELSGHELASELPGAPDGTYVILSFKTSFEHKQTATETVTCMQEKDGAWRVAGYFVR